MKPKAIVKTAADVVMTVLLLLLMAYEMVGRAAHEWIGAGMFLSLIHILGNSENMNNKIIWMAGTLKDLEARGETSGTLDVSSGNKADYSAR